MTYRFSEEAKHHFAEVVDNVAKIGGWVSDLATQRIIWSNQTYAIHDVQEDENISLDEAINFYLPEYRDMVREHYFAATKEGKPFLFEAQISSRKNHIKWVKSHGKPILNDQGVPTMVVGIFEDITQQRKNLDRIVSQQQFLQTIVDSTLEGLVATDKYGVIKSYNSAAASIFNYDENEAVGKNISILMPAHHSTRHNAYMKNYQDTGINKIIGIGREVMGMKKGGEVFPMFLSISEVLMQGEPHYLGTIRDLSKEKENAEKIEWLSNYDDQTGLPNRSYLQSYLSKLDANIAVSVVTINIDRFRRIYLAYGLAQSNKVIKYVAERLQAFCAQGEFISRDIVDRFWIVLKHDKAENRDQLTATISEIKKQLEAPICIDGYNHYITVSIGAAVSEPSSPHTALLSKAELALHETKRRKTSIYVLYKHTDEHAEILDAYNTERQLREGIENNELVFYLQPKHDRLGQLVSAEVLVRWQKPDGQLIFPDAFIDIAEESGLIHQLGRKAIESTAQMLAEIHTIDPNISLAVNVSPSQFLSDDFIDSVTDIFAANHVKLDKLTIEVTENLLASDFALLKEKTKLLTQMGIKISIDDFGTGYSNLQRIQELTISEIKIDKSFTWKCLDEQGSKLLNAMVNVGKSMHLGIVAEGVENEQHLDILRKMGVDTFQGYYYSKPIPFKDFLKKLA